MIPERLKKASLKRTKKEGEPVGEEPKNFGLKRGAINTPFFSDDSGDDGMGNLVGSGL